MAEENETDEVLSEEEKHRQNAEQQQALIDKMSDELFKRLCDQCSSIEDVQGVAEVAVNLGCVHFVQLLQLAGFLPPLSGPGLEKADVLSAMVLEATVIAVSTFKRERRIILAR
jgi:hypothetical protein